MATEAVCIIRAHLKVVSPTLSFLHIYQLKLCFEEHTKKTLTSVLFTLVSFTSQGTIINDILNLSREVPVPASVFIHFDTLSEMKEFAFDTD